MPDLRMYLWGGDVRLLLGHIENDEEIAFIVPDGRRRYKAQRKARALSINKYLLWHVPAGPLPRLERNGPDTWIVAPFKGWEPSPSFAGNPGPGLGGVGTEVFSLEIRLTTTDDNVFHMRPANKAAPRGPWVPCEPDPGAYGPPIGRSDLTWAGNHYNILGEGALKITSAWWTRFGRWVRKVAVRVPMCGPLDTLANAMDCAYAFPEAMAEIRRGRFRGVNPD